MHGSWSMLIYVFFVWFNNNSVALTWFIHVEITHKDQIFFSFFLHNSCMTNLHLCKLWLSDIAFRSKLTFCSCFCFYIHKQFHTNVVLYVQYHAPAVASNDVNAVIQNSAARTAATFQDGRLKDVPLVCFWVVTLNKHHVQMGKTWGETKNVFSMFNVLHFRSGLHCEFYIPHDNFLVKCLFRWTAVFHRGWFERVLLT